MKKTYILFVLLTCITTSCTKSSITISSCNSTSSVLSDSSNFNSDIIEEDNNHKIIVLKKDNQTEYQYYIFNNIGNIMYEGALEKKPDFSYLSNDILQLHSGSGNVSQYQFFNTKENLTSPIYNNPSLVENEKIVYMNIEDGKIKLIISDLFDKLKFHKEYERDFSPVAAPYNVLLSTKLIDSSKLQITYLSGSNFKEVTETIDLN